MIDIAEIDERLSKVLGEKRYTHSVYVAHTAVDLAKTFGADINKAFVAGLVHDCAKAFSYEESLALVKKYDCRIDDVTMRCHGIIHADIGARIAEHEYGIADCEILDAIKYHTVARAGMTLLDKIIYIADMIEPMRDFPDVDEIRNLAAVDLDKAFCRALRCALEFNLAKGNIIHPNTLYAWNDIMNN